MEDSNSPTDYGDLAAMLKQLQEGGEAGSVEILPRVYDELRALARRKLSNEPKGHTLQATALVHEAWMRIAGTGELSIESEAQFFGIAARAMRNVLVDHARRRKSTKRPPRENRREFAADEIASEGRDPDTDIVELEAILAELESDNPDRAKLIELHFFAGMTIAQVARVLGRPEHTVRREWQATREMLRRRLRG